MRKIFLFLFAAVLSITTAMAQDIVVSDGVFQRVDGMWTIQGTHNSLPVTVTLYDFDHTNVPTECTVEVGIGDGWEDPNYDAGEGVAQLSVSENTLTLTVDFVSWFTDETKSLTATAELPDPDAVIIDVTRDLTMLDLQVNGNQLTATGKYSAGWDEATYSVDITLAEPVDGVYTISDATIIENPGSPWSQQIFTFMSGTFTKAYSTEKATDVYTGQVIAQHPYELNYAFNLTLYYEAPEELTITIDDADISWEDGTLVLSNNLHSVRLGGYSYQFKYEGAVTNTVIEGETVAQYENLSTGDYGNTGSITMSIDDSKKITLSATYPSNNENKIYNVTISGTLPTYTVTLNCALANVTLDGTGEYTIGEIVEINAVAPQGWTFDKWTKPDGTRVSNYAQYDFAADKDYNLTANFVLELTEGSNADVLAMNGTTANVKVKRNFYKGDLFTIALPFSINNAESVFGTGTVVYEYAGLSQDTNDDLVIAFNTVSSIAAGKPYLIVPQKNIYSYNGFTVENATISNTTTPISYSVDGTTVTMNPVMSAVTSNNGAYWLAEDTYLYNNNVAVPGLRALFTISTPNGIAPRARVALGENAATGLDNITTGAEVVKTIENGQLIIIRDGVKYNVQGQKL